jgi:hypothetical protein
MPLPWTDYPTDVRQFSGLIQAAAEQRFGSAATVQIIAEAARAADIPLTFQSYSAIASMYGTFVGVRESSRNLLSTQGEVMRTGLDQGVTSSMISQPPWSPGAGSWAQSQFVLVKATYTQPSPAGEISAYFSHRYHISQVQTINQLATDLQAQMEQGAGGTNLEGAQLDSIVSIEWSTP